MSNNQLPAEVETRIDNDAEVYAESRADYLTNVKDHSTFSDLKSGYIAGATAEADRTDEAIDKALHDERNKMQKKITGLEVGYLERIKALEDTLERIVQAPVPATELEMFVWIEVARDMCEEALKQSKGGKDKQVELSCMVCGTKFTGPEPKMCCSGRDCGCMGLPVDPIVCSEECYNKGLPTNNPQQ